jgi:hypothetical protein
MMGGMEAEMKTLESFQERLSMAFQPAEQVVDHFRLCGYLQAQLDPLGQYLQPWQYLNLRLRETSRTKHAACIAVRSELNSCILRIPPDDSGSRSNSNGMHPNKSASTSLIF